VRATVTAVSSRASTPVTRAADRGRRRDHGRVGGSARGADRSTHRAGESARSAALPGRPRSARRPARRRGLGRPRGRRLGRSGGDVVGRDRSHELEDVVLTGGEAGQDPDLSLPVQNRWVLTPLLGHGTIVSPRRHVERSPARYSGSASSVLLQRLPCPWGRCRTGSSTTTEPSTGRQEGRLERPTRRLWSRAVPPGLLPARQRRGVERPRGGGCTFPAGPMRERVD